MNVGPRFDLLARVLDLQPLDEKPLISEGRFRAALTTGPALTREESRVLWTSPATRDRYVRTKAALTSEVSSRLSDHGVGRALFALAAGSDDVVHYLAGDSFSVTVIKADLPDVDWLISLKLEPSYREHLPVLMPVALRDGGGLIWITGTPDAEGQLSGEWIHKGVSPLDRVREHGLVLEP